jgi:hypothetical protein
MRFRRFETRLCNGSLETMTFPGRGTERNEVMATQLKGNAKVVAQELYDYHHRSWVEADSLASSLGKKTGIVKKAASSLVELGLAETKTKDDSVMFRLNKTGRTTARNELQLS